MRRFVLTGPPGAGKTSLLAELAGRGQRTVPEAATDVIAEGHRRGVAELVNTPIRRIDPADAREFGRLHVTVYERFGFALHRIPVLPPAERAELVLAAVSQGLDARANHRRCTMIPASEVILDTASFVP